MTKIPNSKSLYLYPDGRVYCSELKKFIKVGKAHTGYLRFWGFKISRNKKVLWLHHRAVYETIIGVIPNGYQINHIDGNKTNNSIENLEAITPAENVRHSREVLGNKYKKSIRSLSSNQVKEIAKLWKKKSIVEISKELGVCSRIVSQISRKKTRSYKDFKHLFNHDEKIIYKTISIRQRGKSFMAYTNINGKQTYIISSQSMGEVNRVVDKFIKDNQNARLRYQRKPKPE